MGLSSSMWAGVTGLLAHGQRMGLISNNLANVNTVAYKGSNMYFEDLISQNIGTSAGVAQIGTGVTIGAVYADLSQGGFETTTDALDMAIGGNGYYIVKEKTSTGENGQALSSGNLTSYYTRAGNFRFDNDGYLVDTNGYVVQGWEVDSAKVRSNEALGITTTQVPIKGSIKDIKLDQFQIPAQATQNMTVTTQLDSAETDHATSTTDPFFAMATQWDGQNVLDDEDALADTAFAYQTTMKVYDQNGTSHNITIYYDKVTVSNSGGKSYWEYIVTCDPLEDGRTLPDSNGGLAVSTTATAGLLMMGTLTFDASGNLENTSAYTLSSTATVSGGGVNLTEWEPAEISTSGYPVFTANFRSVSNGSATDSANAINIALNMGIRNTGGFVGGATTAAGVGTSQTNLTGFNSATTKFNSNITTSNSTSSTTLFNSQDGYTAGMLTGVSVDQDGVLTGTFSNGQTMELYAIALADFSNSYGLSRAGSNLFTETIDSGQPTTGRANTGRLGTISGNTLETSNVDLASEMVDMILTQRGFQANSKTITTVDTMLAEVIQLKR
ncbi:flagellar hook protein FlgE [Desulfovibrio sulfodismutans]|uniref:Flagellar hook protein FlgE n=1 Tax=Desulfolutivibrio sulfodismutans TaxID=63561 RepID=A0A7K3NNV9_9BACT|nr:flagellar hook protein FlgE [Desulfolutivibrio sulfodismutans]NDY57807.1 flagellar hook protein FlgE [Desulfolutivibrio sulfodismutans]QLA11925.1 flagellar hook-basal body complex protein [Desulfolutivibrio sulfodismutans DSM 3696]